MRVPESTSNVAELAASAMLFDKVNPAVASSFPAPMVNVLVPRALLLDMARTPEVIDVPLV